MDFAKTCRTCLAEDSDAEMLSIFAFDKDQQFSAMIAACSKTEVSHHDGLPDRICLLCCDQLRDCLAFKIKCEESFSKLQSYRDSIISPGDQVHCRSNTTIGDNRKLKDCDLFDPQPNEKSIQTDEVTFYVCNLCDMKFVSEDALKIHRSIHQDGGFKCLVCSTMFDRLDHMRRHIVSAHPDAAKDDERKLYDIVCNLCNRRFARTYNLQRHLLTHGINQIKMDDETDERLECATHETFESADEMLAHGKCVDFIMEPTIEIKFSTDQPIETTIPPELKSSPDDVQFSATLKIENQSDYSDAESSPDMDGDYFEDPVETLAEEIEDQEEEEESLTKTPKRGRGRPRKTTISTSPEILPANQGRTKKITLPDEDQVSPKKATPAFQCHMCAKLFSRQTHLNRHLVIHSNEKPFVCEVCSKGFTRLDHLNIHRHHHSDVKPYNCDICKQGFTRAAHLQRHTENRHANGAESKMITADYVCEMCPKAYSTPKSLKLHMKIHTEKVYVCKFCRINFSNQDELDDHNKMHNHEKPFLCSECGARFVRNDYLTVHMRRHKGEKPYKCRYCGKGFPRATDLNVHERYHTGVKTHLCTTCGKGFQRAYNLLVHMRVHTGERPYQCSHCDKSFAQGNDLKTHVRRHTGERYKCELCGEGFIQIYHLTQHKKKKHGIDVQSHIQRVEKFSQPNEEDGGNLDEVEEILVEDLDGVACPMAEEKTDQELLEPNVRVDEEEGRFLYHM